MAFSEFELKQIETAAKDFEQLRRPPAHIRPELDVRWYIQGQSVIVSEYRPMWNNPSEIQEFPSAKATYVKSRKHWKLYWMRRDLKWHRYDEDNETHRFIKDVFTIIHTDQYGCFFG